MQQSKKAKFKVFTSKSAEDNFKILRRRAFLAYTHHALRKEVAFLRKCLDVAEENPSLLLETDLRSQIQESLNSIKLTIKETIYLIDVDLRKEAESTLQRAECLLNNL